jgi:ferrochelatase
MTRDLTGVLVMAYGTPASLDDIEAYYTHIRRGRPPSPEQLADLRRRYEAIGGVSPLLERTTAQVDALRRELGEGFVVELGQKHAAPFIEDGMRALSGGDVVIGVVLAPHYSSLSVGDYAARAEAVGRIRMVESWHLEQGLISLLAERVTDAVGRFGDGARIETLFTAHSLPARILEMDDPYPDQLQQTASAVAARAGLKTWREAWQSAGRTPEPWIGPDILEVIRGLPDEGFDGVVVCPAGFVSDHLEVLYDIDVEARGVAEEVGLRLERTASLNDDPRFIKTLAGVVRSRSR